MALSTVSFKIAAVQASPVYLDREATIAKACDFIAMAGGEGAQLIVFPEAFIPTYPGWIWHLAPGHAGDMVSALYAELLDQAVTIPSDATDRLCEAAHQAGAYVAIGMNERNAEASNGSLYNTLLYIDADGQILGKHRKMVPTGPERLIWAQGDGSTLSVYDTPFGKISGLICFENYMPLARYALYAWAQRFTLPRPLPGVRTGSQLSVISRRRGGSSLLDAELSSERAIFRIDMPSSKPISRISMSGLTSATVRF